MNVLPGAPDCEGCEAVTVGFGRNVAVKVVFAVREKVQTAFALAPLQANDMAAALVNDGAIRLELFNDVNGEQFGVFSKIEPLLTEIRADYSAQFGAQLEKLIDATPEGRKRVAAIRERMKSVRATLAQQQAQAHVAL